MFVEKLNKRNCSLFFIRYNHKEHYLNLLYMLITYTYISRLFVQKNKSRRLPEKNNNHHQKMHATVSFNLCISFPMHHRYSNALLIMLNELFPLKNKNYLIYHQKERNLPQKIPFQQDLLQLHYIQVQKLVLKEIIKQIL